MNKEQIRTYLREDPNKIKDILEYLGCNKVKIISNKRVQSTRPDGNNPTSVQVLLNDTLSTIVHTKNEYDKYKYKDIYTLVEYLSQTNFNEAINIICKVCGLKYDYNTDKKLERSQSADFLRMFKKKKEKECVEKIIQENVLNRFIDIPSYMFYEDYCSIESQEYFEVKYDLIDNRVIIPIRNANGELIGVKGRTCNTEYKQRGIPKFLHYYECNARYYLYGLYQNYFDILASKKVYIVESEKGVIQLWGMGCKNAVSISKKIISEEQLSLLLKLGVEVVVCLDKDVDLESVKMECRKFKRLCKVGYVYDTDNLLDNKMSITDKGKEICDILINNYTYEFNE